MGIKYHQYGCGNDYGDDHYLTDNWNPDYDYGSQYVEVYFNINTPSYMHAKDSSAFGFASDETRDEWYAAASKVIASFDILEDSGYNVENSAEKRAYLYPHPQQISGVILKNDVRKVAEAIECMSLSSIRWVDLYDTVYVLSDEAYEKYLMFKDEALKKDMFDVCQTPRITRFYDAIEISRALAMKYRLKRLGINDGRNYGSGQTIDHIMRLMQKMSEDGLLVMTSPSGEETYVRSLNKTELKKWIRSHMMLRDSVSGPSYYWRWTICEPAGRVWKGTIWIKIFKRSDIIMWTIMWTENSQDRWDRLETKEEVMQLLDSLDKNSGVSKGDVWIFPPQADDLALTGNDF